MPPIHKSLENRNMTKDPAQERKHDELRRLITDRQKQLEKEPSTRSRERQQKALKELGESLDRASTPSEARRQAKLVQQIAETLPDKSQKPYHPYKQEQISQEELFKILNQEADRFIRGDKSLSKIDFKKIRAKISRKWKSLKNFEKFTNLWRQIENDAQEFRSYHFSKAEKNPDTYRELIEKLSASHQAFGKFVKEYNKTLKDLSEESKKIKGIIHDAIENLEVRIGKLDGNINDQENGYRTELGLEEIKNNIVSRSIHQEDLTNNIKDLNKRLSRSRKEGPSSTLIPLSIEKQEDSYYDLFPEIESGIKDVSDAIQESLKKEVAQANIPDREISKQVGSSAVQESPKKEVTQTSIPKALSVIQESLEEDMNADNESVGSLNSFESREGDLDIDIGL